MAKARECHPVSHREERGKALRVHWLRWADRCANMDAVNSPPGSEVLPGTAVCGCTEGGTLGAGGPAACHPGLPDGPGLREREAERREREL